MRQVLSVPSPYRLCHRSWYPAVTIRVGEVEKCSRASVICLSEGLGSDGGGQRRESVACRGYMTPPFEVSVYGR